MASRVSHASQPPDVATEHRRISVAQPILDGRELEYVMECLHSTRISSIGRFVDEFERALADYCGVRHAVATCNGTAALHLSLVALGIGPGDEVIVPTLTYVATANAVRYCNATPVFVDCDPLTLNLDPTAVAARITSRTRAVIPVHLYGHPADMAPIMKLAVQHGLAVIEDAAEAIGARYRGQQVGGIGTCATFSFYGNKIVTTGEGGAVTTNDDTLAKLLRTYRGQGMDPERRYFFPIVGFNYRMPNIVAAIGVAQMERIEQHLGLRKAVAAGYRKRLGALAPRIVLPTAEDWADHAWWMFTIMLTDRATIGRDAVMRRLEDCSIETRPVFYPLHTMPPYREYGAGAFPNSEQCAARGINLPTHGGLTEADLDYICSVLGEILA
ncbi:MAG TPA: DegT/DnrJ/EryC1/StrS family aminotransferase [Xanthobacteraceae bacterium]|nr:DegT/DnrJ/EryC1/StrS family aminotransferase [Xanthobacteraceae bacterium]